MNRKNTMVEIPSIFTVRCWVAGGFTMILHFKEEQYGWGDTFYVLDENNQRKYFVKSSVLLWNKKWEIFDLDKHQLVVIKNDPKSLLKKKYYIMIGGQQIASVTKEISLIPKYTIEGLDWEMHGVMLHEYEMLKDGQEVLSLHIENTNWGTRPVLEIASTTDELSALSIAMTISYVMNAKEDGTPTNHI